MLPSKTLLSLIVLTLSAAVDASPSLLSRQTGKATLGFTTKINAHGIVNVVEKDRARVQALRQVGQLGSGKSSALFNVANNVFFYTAEVGVGEPATNYTLLVDTGSSITFVGANKPYVQTNSSKDTGNTVLVTYGSGFFSGEEWLDTVTLAPGLVINQQSIGVAISFEGFAGVNGILGLGPVDLTSGAVSNTSTVPTVLDNLLAQGAMSQEVLGVNFVPSSESTSSGELTFGGYDDSVITGPVNYVPLTTTSPAGHYWGFNQSISYGNTTILSSTAGIVDTGTTLILIASDAFMLYQSATGGIPDPATGLLSITPAQYANLKPLTFNIGGMSYDLAPNAQIWPRALNTVIGGNASAIYLIVSDMISRSGAGMDFINGYTFLERYYSVYDTPNRRVGFASTAYTGSTLN